MPAPDYQPSPFERLTTRNSELYHADELTIRLVELNAEEATEIWPQLSELEKEGRLVDIYRLLVFHGAEDADGAPVFASLAHTGFLPVRHLVPMGEAMLRLCDMGLDAGNVQGDPSETSPTG